LRKRDRLQAGAGLDLHKEVVEMSREIENVTAAFKKARIEGNQMLSSGRITWEDFVFIMVGFEDQLRRLGKSV